MSNQTIREVIFAKEGLPSPDTAAGELIEERHLELLNRIDDLIICLSMEVRTQTDDELEKIRTNNVFYPVFFNSDYERHGELMAERFSLFDDFKKEADDAEKLGFVERAEFMRGTFPMLIKAFELNPNEADEERAERVKGVWRAAVNSLKN